MAAFLFDVPQGTPSMSPRHYLDGIADFLTAQPDAWTRHAYAVTADGMPCDPSSSRARRWCTLGLLMKFVEEGPMRQACERLLSNALTPASSMLGLSPAHFNDVQARTVDDVISLFRSAARSQRYEPPSAPGCGCAGCQRTQVPAMSPAPQAVPDWWKMLSALPSPPPQLEPVEGLARAVDLA